MITAFLFRPYAYSLQEENFDGLNVGRWENICGWNTNVLIQFSLFISSITWEFCKSLKHSLCYLLEDNIVKKGIDVCFAENSFTLVFCSSTIQIFST